jgi:hypothetical protein
MTSAARTASPTRIGSRELFLRGGGTGRALSGDGTGRCASAAGGGAVTGSIGSAGGRSSIPVDAAAAVGPAASVDPVAAGEADVSW